MLSPKELELLDRVRQVQRHLRMTNPRVAPLTGAAISTNLVTNPRASPSQRATVASMAPSTEHNASTVMEMETAMEAEATDAAGASLRVREVGGAALSAHDGRCGFLLAFGADFELHVEVPMTARGEGGDGRAETVRVLFAGTAEAPLLVQRVGRAREEAAAAAEGAQAGTSGAAAAPQLGCVPSIACDGSSIARDCIRWPSFAIVCRVTALGCLAAAPSLRSYVTKRALTNQMEARERQLAEADAALYDAAVRAAAAHWRGGKRRALAVPPRGLQWELRASAGHEEAAEADVYLTAE